MSEEDDMGLGDVFEEPPRPPTPPPTFTTYHRKSSDRERLEWTSVELELVGHHVLWAQHLWNAAIVLADFLDARSDDLCKGKSVLELGAGGALPSLIAALCGARNVVITDYPDRPLIENIQRNVDRNISGEMRSIVKVQGYVWGTDPRKLSGTVELERNHAHLPEVPGGEDSGHMLGDTLPRFDVIILSDLIFNHSQHAALLDTCEAALLPNTAAGPLQGMPGPKTSRHEGAAGLDITPTPCVLVFYSHHRPQHAARDLTFFEQALARGWDCQKVVQTKMLAMFPDDPGDEEMRSTVHGWVLRRHNPYPLPRPRKLRCTRLRIPTLHDIPPLGTQCSPSLAIPDPAFDALDNPLWQAMRPSFVVATLFALASSVAATCPLFYVLVPKGNKCVCENLYHKTVPLLPGCTATLKNTLGIKWCLPTCHPQPSHKPKPKRNQPILLPDGTLERCPLAMTACPMDAPPSLNGDRSSATISMNDPYECIKPEEDLHNCGGCSSTGKGMSCNDIVGVRGTSCTEGKCLIYTCQKGYRLAVNDQGAQECVRKNPRRV